VTAGPAPADWQLPPGVSRGLWDYLHSSTVARGYDAALAGSTLFVADERFVLQHCANRGSLIDLGCGTGRLLVRLARQGYRVVGVDLSEEMLAVAREKAAAAGRPVGLLRANLAELDSVGECTFDYAACLFSTLGMITGAAARRGAVEHVLRILRPGGRFVLHVHNRWFNAWDRRGRRWLLANLLAAAAGRGDTGDREMPVHHGVAGLSLHQFTRSEVINLLRSSGFRIVAIETVGLGADGKLAWSAVLPSLRAYGYLIAAAKPG
jgi:SAM-dependent methyltransferase